jgi:hypothetical protein
MFYDLKSLIWHLALSKSLTTNGTSNSSNFQRDGLGLLVLEHKETNIKSQDQCFLSPRKSHPATFARLGGFLSAKPRWDLQVLSLSDLGSGILLLDRIQIFHAV